VWAPAAERVDVLFPHQGRAVPLEPAAHGYHSAIVSEVLPGARYLYRLNGERTLPDPASRSQPDGVHEPSEVIDPRSFPWSDGDWRGLPLAGLVLYELHVGTFSPEGTFDGVVPHLDELVELGVTAVEIMPVSQFPGSRNWGYDGAYPYAAQSSYGGAAGLARLVDRCHRRGLAVVLDVVYNHLGPEGNYLSEFGPYFTDRYRTPWGAAINFDGPGSDEVRRYFIGNGMGWLGDFHFDGLRIDAIHGIVDTSAHPFLQELEEAKQRLEGRVGRRLHLIAESDLNDSRIVARREVGGFGLDAQWNDDFHHSLHAMVTGEDTGYYGDFGSMWHLTRAIGEGYVYSGQYSAFRGRRHGNSSREIPAERFVIFDQNHDQVGNRARGERLSALVSFEALKLAAGTLLLSPGLPLLFMGEEYGETAPFQYFVSHTDPGLVESVRRGRTAEFASFEWAGAAPDPQDEGTFLRSKLDHSLKGKEQHRMLLELYRELLRLRREHSALALLSRDHMEIASEEGERTMTLRRWDADEEALAVMNFGEAPAAAPIPAGRPWRLLLDSADERWGGPGSSLPSRLDPSAEDTLVVVRPTSFALFERRRDVGGGS
jgi:maltooligosyltrehalose trehalohydrolase